MLTDAVRMELIKALSGEINKISELVYQFRTKISFVAWIGPFLILGSYLVATNGRLVFEPNNMAALIIIALMVVGCYIGIGYISARIEVQAWEYCNKLRKIIANLSSGKADYSIDPKEYYDTIADIDTSRGKYTIPEREIVLTYMVAYSLMIFSAILLVVLISITAR